MYMGSTDHCHHAHHARPLVHNCPDHISGWVDAGPGLDCYLLGRSAVPGLELSFGAAEAFCRRKGGFLAELK